MTDEQATGDSPVHAEAAQETGETAGSTTPAGGPADPDNCSFCASGLPEKALALMQRLDRRSMVETARVQADLLESTRAQLRKVELTLELVRDDIDDLLDKPWLPNPEMIKAALWPMQERVKMRLDEEMPPVINEQVREGRSTNGIF